MTVRLIVDMICIINVPDFFFHAIRFFFTGYDDLLNKLKAILNIRKHDLLRNATISTGV